MASASLRRIEEKTHDVVNNCTQLFAERCGQLYVINVNSIVHRKVIAG